MKLNAMQIKTLKKHISAKALHAYTDAVVAAGAVDTLTIVGKDGFIYDIAEDGQLVPKNHNLQEDLAMKGIGDEEFLAAVELEERKEQQEFDMRGYNEEEPF